MSDKKPEVSSQPETPKKDLRISLNKLSLKEGQLVKITPKMLSRQPLSKYSTQALIKPETTEEKDDDSVSSTSTILVPPFGLKNQF